MAARILVIRRVDASSVMYQLTLVEKKSTASIQDLQNNDCLDYDTMSTSSASLEENLDVEP